MSNQTHLNAMVVTLEPTVKLSQDGKDFDYTEQAMQRSLRNIRDMDMDQRPSLVGFRLINGPLFAVDLAHWRDTSEIILTRPAAESWRN